LQHIFQLQQKKLQQAVIEQAVQSAGRLMGGGAAAPGATPAGAPGGGVLNFPNGVFGPGAGRAKGKHDAVTEPKGNPLATGPDLYSGHPEILHEQ
jgi:hypothetical protein